jgi:hypothetical protein
VPAELFEAVQRQLAQKTRRRTDRGDAPDLFSGLVYCSACGGPLVRAGANPPVLQCGRYARGQCAISHSISRRKLEQTALDGLRPVLEPITIDTAEKTAFYWQKRLRQIEHRLRRAAEAYRNGVDTLAEYQAVKTQLETERTACRTRMNAADGARNLWGQLQDERLPVMYRRMLLQAVVERMVYHRRGERLDIYLR